MTRFVASIACALGLLLAATPGARAGMDADKLLSTGAPAPAFTFTDAVTGGAMAMQNVARGRPLLLVFLQTACQSCYREMMSLKKLREGGTEFDVLGIFLDMKAKDFQKYITENELPFSFGWDSGYTIADSYGVSFTPASFLLDADRKVAAVYRGFHPGIESSLKADLARLAGR